jgi:hypothetical protein
VEQLRQEEDLKTYKLHSPTVTLSYIPFARGRTVLRICSTLDVLWVVSTDSPNSPTAHSGGPLSCEARLPSSDRHDYEFLVLETRSCWIGQSRKPKAVSEFDVVEVVVMRHAKAVGGLGGP